MKRNILLLFLSIVLAFIIAYPFGHFVLGALIFTNRFSSFLIPNNVADFIDGLLFGFILISPFVYVVWGEGRKFLSSIISISPLLVLNLYIGAGKRTWFWFVVLFAIGVILGVLLHPLFRKKLLNKIK